MPQLLKIDSLNINDNKLNIPPGSLAIADNIVIDRNNIANSRRGYKDYGDPLPSSNYRVSQLLEYKTRIFRHYNNTLQFDSDNAGTFLTFDGIYSPLDAGLRIKYKEVNSNLYFTTNEGIRKISATSPSEFSTLPNYITNAGGVKALDLNNTINYEASGFLPPSSKVAYRLVWGTNDKNNNLILGSPSSRLVVTNITSDTTIPEKTDITTVADVGGSLAGTYFLLYDGDGNGYFAYYDNTGSVPEPIGSDTIGKIAIKITMSNGDSASNIAIKTANKLFSLDLWDVSVNGSILEIVNKTGSSTIDASNGLTSPGFSIVVVNQGQIVYGQYATPTISSVIPADIINTNYFYQIYRTAISTISTGVTLSDIDPGDEMQLIYETGVSSAELIAKVIVFEDTIPDSFRESGTYLYTNPSTGQGILQANEKPPIAKDIELFKNTTFYANTRTIHRKQLSLISTSGFVSGSSSIIIGSGSTSRKYTFVGSKEIFSMSCDTKANTVDGGYILFNSASDLNQYFLWFDKTGSTIEPSAADTIGKIAIKIDISAITASADIASAIYNAINALEDFSAVLTTSTQLTIENINNGASTDVTFGLTSPAGGGSTWAVAVIQQGTGEIAASNQVLLSGLLSVSQAIDETARSLINVINQDSSSPVYGYYLSGPQDLPGLMMFESRTMSDIPFYFAVEGSVDLGTKFSPELSEVQVITNIALNGDVTCNGHGLADGQQVFIYGSNSTPIIDGLRNISGVTINTFNVGITVSVTGNTGKFFLADIYSDNEVKGNRIYYSKISQPEAVPLVNYMDIGVQDSTISRILALRNSLFVLKKDEGVFLITGVGGNFSVQLIDNVSIIAPDSAVVLNNLIYGLFNQGVCQISDTGATAKSMRIENAILNVTREGYSYATSAFGVAYEKDRAYMLWLPSVISDTVATQAYRFSTYNESWVRWTKTNTCGLIKKADNKMYLGAGDRYYVEQERKNGDRTDYADREFIISLPLNCVDDMDLFVSSTANVAQYDVIAQDQYLTLTKFNRLLKKLDLDTGLDDTDYFSTLELVYGGSPATQLTTLVSKLNIDDPGQGYTSSGLEDIVSLKNDFNGIIVKLNNVASSTAFKDYIILTELLTFETLVESVNTVLSYATCIFKLPFLKGAATIYKGYESILQWSPETFGDSESLKQVTEGSLIFDGNNFYSAILSYASDLSRDYEDIHVYGLGPNYSDLVIPGLGAGFEDITIYGSGSGVWGMINWGDTPWGGQGKDVPIRTLIPRAKQRCRFITCKFTHNNAREPYSLLGMTLKVRQVSTRAYR